MGALAAMTPDVLQLVFVQVERLADPIAPVATILARVPANRLMQLYRIGPFTSAESMLAHIATARGKLRKGGAPDITVAARIVLQDWNDGRIPFFTRPPSRGNEGEESAQLMAQYAADFDADAVFSAEASAVIAGLPREQDGAYVEAQSAGAVQVCWLGGRPLCISCVQTFR
jgi:nuclear GTP-binding protein